MSSEDEENGSNSQPATSRSRPNQVKLQAGRIEVEVEGFADEKELMELASEQMESQMRRWCEVDRQVLSTQADGLFAIGGDR